MSLGPPFKLSRGPAALSLLEGPPGPSGPPRGGGPRNGSRRSGGPRKSAGRPLKRSGPFMSSKGLLRSPVGGPLKSSKGSRKSPGPLPLPGGPLKSWNLFSTPLCSEGGPRPPSRSGRLGSSNRPLGPLSSNLLSLGPRPAGLASLPGRNSSRGPNRPILGPGAGPSRSPGCLPRSSLGPSGPAPCCPPLVAWFRRLASARSLRGSYSWPDGGPRSGPRFGPRSGLRSGPNPRSLSRPKPGPAPRPNGGGGPRRSGRSGLSGLSGPQRSGLSGLSGLSGPQRSLSRSRSACQGMSWPAWACAGPPNWAAAWGSCPARAGGGAWLKSG